MFLSILGAGLGTWALGLGAFAVLQRRLIFRPPVAVRTLPPGPWADSYRIESLSLQPAPGVTLQGWRSLPSDGAAPAGVLWYLGGRGENVAWAPHMSSWLRHWSVLAFNYRGFGGSTGLATEAHLRADLDDIGARFVPACSPGRLLAVMGRSLGTGLAVPLAARCRPDALVLVSPLCSVRALVTAQPLLAPARWLLQHPMDALSHAAQVSCPSLVILAPGDRQVPNRHSLRLAKRLGGPVQIQTVAGAQHRTLPRSVATQAQVAGFLQAQLNSRS